jgi:hypothetical protein
MYNIFNQNDETTRLIPDDLEPTRLNKFVSNVILLIMELTIAQVLTILPLSTSSNNSKSDWGQSYEPKKGKISSHPYKYTKSDLSDSGKW